MNVPEESGKTGGKRLQAYLASCGLGSRRACERYITEGRVLVDGRIAELGQRVPEAAEVRVDGKTVHPQERLRYILLNKPAGYLSAMSDPEGRRLAVDLLREAVPERVYNVGRLDQWSSGLLLFTNDGNLAARLGHPSGGFEKEYEVFADKDLPEAFFREFAAGVLVDGILYKAASLTRSGGRRARVTLIEGQNREIRRVLAHWDIRALSLRRVRIGPISIEGLPEGNWRELEPEEVAQLESPTEARSR
ncbi:MAG: pseudouridine synthase [Rectinemataceae bacterium]